MCMTRNLRLGSMRAARLAAPPERGYPVEPPYRRLCDARGSVATAKTASLFAGSAGGGAPLDRRTRGARAVALTCSLTPPSAARVIDCAPHAATTGRRIRDCASFA